MRNLFDIKKMLRKGMQQGTNWKGCLELCISSIALISTYFVTELVLNINHFSYKWFCHQFKKGKESSERGFAGIAPIYTKTLPSTILKPS